MSAIPQSRAGSCTSHTFGERHFCAWHRLCCMQSSLKFFGKGLLQQDVSLAFFLLYPGNQRPFSLPLSESQSLHEKKFISLGVIVWQKYSELQGSHPSRKHPCVRGHSQTGSENICMLKRTSILLPKLGSLHPDGRTSSAQEGHLEDIMHFQNTLKHEGLSKGFCQLKNTEISPSHGFIHKQLYYIKAKGHKSLGKQLFP